MAKRKMFRNLIASTKVTFQVPQWCDNGFMRAHAKNLMTVAYNGFNMTYTFKTEADRNAFAGIFEDVKKQIEVK